MRRSSTILVIVALLTAPATALAADFSEAGFEHAITTLRCDCGCHPQSLKDCACGYAARKREEIHGTMVDQNLDGEAMVAVYVAEYGEQILLIPPATGFNLVAWLGPLFGLVLATFGLAALLRRWRRSHESGAPGAGDPLPTVDPVYAERLQQQLREME